MTLVPRHEGGRVIERTALSKLWESLYGAIELLAEQEITPDCFTHTALRMPFGRFGDSHITTSMTVDENFVSGTISFASSDNPEESFSVNRELGNTSWRGNGHKYSNWGIARKLDANWPQQLIDNTAVRRLASPRDKNVSDDDLFQLVETELAPNARYFTIEKIYAYSTIRIDPETDALSAIAFRLAVTEDHDEFRQYHTQLTMPYTCDEVPTSLHSRTTFDELGNFSIETWYDHPETGKPVEVTLASADMVLEEVIGYIADLVEEKTTTATAA